MPVLRHRYPVLSIVQRRGPQRVGYASIPGITVPMLKHNLRPCSVHADTRVKLHIAFIFSALFVFIYRSIANFSCCPGQLSLECRPCEQHARLRA